jgi:membrane associated rhomboid family serine protease
MTIFFIGITALISFMAFNNPEVFSKLQLNPYQVYHRKEWYRLITHGFVHADWMHLIVNMFVLYMFGRNAEFILSKLEDLGYLKYYQLWYTGFYISSIVIASLLTVAKHRDNYYYNSVGASGAVSAVVFFFIFFDPYNTLYLFAIIPIPAIIFGAAYLIYSQYMSRKGNDNVNHDAHFVGAVFGFLFPLLIDFSLLKDFIDAFLTFDFFRGVH